MSTTFANTASPQVSTAKSGFIIGPIADSLLIIGAPLLALILGGILFAVPESYFQVVIKSHPTDVRQIVIAAFINAHLFLVYFRSHTNPDIFRLYPWRFIAVPLTCIVLGASFPPVLITMAIISTWWDVYHSSLQTFGFGRIYDSKQKNDAMVGRRLDYWMNLVVYLGPVLAGAHFVDHLDASRKDMAAFLVQRSTLTEMLCQRTPDFLQEHQFYLAAAILSVGVPFVLYYLYSYYRFQRQGYRISWQKVWLMIITSCVSIYCWGFHSYIDAFWVMNFFHALQYFAIVGFSEKRNLAQLFHVNRFSYGWVIAFAWVVSFCLLYGLWSGFFAADEWAVSLIVTTSIMHFWYDGFIWSVKKKQV